MRLPTRLAAAALCSLPINNPSLAQQLDSARCRALLNGPTHDSMTVRVGMAVTSFDTNSVVSPTYRGLFIQAMRQELKVPRPLPTDFYAFYTPRDARGGVIGSTTLVPGVAGDYRATLKRDGHISNARVVGGARTKAFDDAILAAIRAVGDSQAAPPFAEDTKADTVELRLSVRIDNFPAVARAPGQYVDPPFEPLFAMRVGALGFPSAMVRADPKNPNPRYPGLARMARADGQIVAEYIVTADGRADLRSLQFLNATAIQFVDAVLEVLPNYRYTPLAIFGCPVATLVRVPFTFEILR